MSNEGEKKCPLCAEEMDWTDQQLKPCQCGYEVCVWCWHHIMEMSEKEETEGRCPACRTPYDKERIVGMEANCKRVVASKKDQKSKPQKAKPKKPEVGKDLSGVRVIQRKMAYVIGLPLSLADENLLQRKDFFGQYGKVLKVSLSRTAGGAIQQFVNDTCSAYITYSKEEEAIRCIQSIHGFVLEGSFLRASFGTAKYCHAWLRNVPCINAACLYLHTIGADEDSFSKDEEAAVHTRNRVHQIVGATHDMQLRSGNTLPSPLDDPSNGNRVATDKAITGSAQKDTTPASQTSSGNLNCSYSSLDKNGRIKTPNKTFVDIVEGSSYGLEKDSSVVEDRKMLNLCDGFSSVGIEGANHLETEYSDSVVKKFSSSCHLPTELPRDKDSEEYFVKPFSETSKFSMFERTYFPSSDACIGNGHSFLLSDSDRQVVPGSCSDVREDFLCFDGQRSKGSDSLSEVSPVLSSSYPTRIPGHSNDNVQQCKETHTFGDYTVERRAALSTLKPSNSFSDEKTVEKLRRLDDNHISNHGDTSALDVVESSIISNILSMNFDSCTDSLTSPHSLTDLLDGTGGRHGSWNIRNSDESRFSFAKTGNSVNRETGQASNKYSSLPDSIEKEQHYLRGPQNHVSRCQSSIPPGFSAPSREPPPGFPPRERTKQALSVTSGNHLFKTSYVPNGQYHAGNISNNRDFHFGDPAVLVVGDKSTSTLSFETRPAPTPQTYEDEARLWLMMQQSGSNTPQDATFPSTFMDKTSSSHQELRCSVPTGNGFSPMGNHFGLMDSHHSYISHVPQMSQQKYGNLRMPDAYGGVGLDEAQLIQRNERLGSNQFFPGYGGGDLMFQMPSTGDVYNRVYGL